MNLGTHQLTQQQVPGDRGRNHVDRHDVVFKSRLGAAGRDEACLIRVIVVDVDDGVVAAFEDVPDLKFEVATLVATERQTGSVITLH